MRMLSSLVAVALTLSIAPVLLAIPVPIQSTGLGGIYTSVRGGDIDPDWIITQINDPNPGTGVPSPCQSGPCAAAIVDIPNLVNPPGWVANDANSAWVWVNPDASPTAYNPPNMTALIETQFTLPNNVDLSNITLAFRMAADNTITAVRLNGVLVPGVSFASNGAFSSTTFITTGFQSGVNTLEFAITDSGTFGGFRVEIDPRSQFGTLVPEPGSLALMAGGLIALVAAARRRYAR